MEEDSSSERENGQEIPGPSRKRCYPSAWMSGTESQVVNKKLKRSQSETKTESSRTMLLGSLRSRSPESRQVVEDTLPYELMVTTSQTPLEDMQPNSISSSISSVQLFSSDSDTSGYTTESSYQTASGYERLAQTSSYASIQTYYGPADFLWEIHLAIDPSATGEEVQSVHQDMRDLLINEMGLIGDTNNQAIYLIAYNYM
ncbi:uncharacterized protein LOC108138900 [Drosophila elegans]|uniref:uncharacterized protein LOC108138900 n=1 Tax=Drosophila elegans TaxID=30023 RepID=UPI0007E84AC6|nr:uncharacterized protein LOC108138900 [Drosophila elegans]